MENFSNWDNEEIKTLFKFVEIKKSEGVPLVKIFEQYANCTQRQKNSVRNFYYKELSNLQEDKMTAKNLGICLNNHIVNKGVPFSKAEEKDVVQKIGALTKEGYSVRKACLTLSNGDVPTMLRLQNKYRALTKHKEKKSSMGQIIKMPTRSDSLSEEDLKVLFLGLVRLVKKQEYQNAKNIFEKEIFSANEKLKKAIAELVVKQNKIEQLQSEISLVKSKLEAQKEYLIKKRIGVVNNKKTASATMKEYFSLKQEAKSNSL